MVVLTRGTKRTCQSKKRSGRWEVADKGECMRRRLYFSPHRSPCYEIDPAAFVVHGII